MNSSLTLRDFFYLDIEKVRSFVAQLREGLPDAFEKTHLHKGEGGINFGLRADYAYERAETETRSLHHYLYTILESTLRDSGKLLEIDGSFACSDWRPDLLTDGRFVLIGGTINLLDFQTAVEGIQGLPRIMEVAAKFQQQALAKQRQAGEITQQAYERARSEAKQTLLPRKDVDDIASIIRDLYAGMVRVKVYPYGGDSEHYFAGTLLSEYLQRERPRVYASGQASPASTLYAFGLIDQATPTRNVPPQPEEAVLEERVANILRTFSEFGKLTVTTAWPVVTFTPLAVYRKV